MYEFENYRKVRKIMKIVFFWESKDCGFYLNLSFEMFYCNIGYNNGNLVFVYVVKMQIQGDILFYLWYMCFEVFNQVDFVVIFCVNQFGKYIDFGGLVNNLVVVEKLIVVIGLGVQVKEFGVDVELIEGICVWLDVLIENGCCYGIQNIYICGFYILEQIVKLIGVEIMVNGCLLYFINLCFDFGMQIEKNWNVNLLFQCIVVVGGYESWWNMCEIEQQLILLMMDLQFFGIYIVQFMGNMIKILCGLFDEIELEVLDWIYQYIVLYYSCEQFKIWVLNYVCLFYDVVVWMDELCCYDLLIGLCFYGVQLVIQVECMVCIVIIDIWIEEMCCEIGVFYLCVDDLIQFLMWVWIK